MRVRERETRTKRDRKWTRNDNSLFEHKGNLMENFRDYSRTAELLIKLKIRFATKMTQVIFRKRLS